MVLSFEQEKELEQLKHDQKKELIEINKKVAEEEHERKMKRLDKLLEIAKAGGSVKEEA
jgi:tRNA A37 N6-isopentenylltransferase MiaA